MDGVKPCEQCRMAPVTTRTPTHDGKSFVRTIKCGCSMLTYREDLAVKVWRDDPTLTPRGTLSLVAR